MRPKLGVLRCLIYCLILLFEDYYNTGMLRILFFVSMLCHPVRSHRNYMEQSEPKLREEVRNGLLLRGKPEVAI